MLVHGAHWVAQREAISKCLRHTLLPSPLEPCIHWPKGCVFRKDFLGYLYSHFIYNPDSKTERTKYMVDKFMQDIESNPTSAPVYL